MATVNHKIMSQPLPAILNYIEERIDALEQAEKLARAAAEEAKGAAASAGAVAAKLGEAAIAKALEEIHKLDETQSKLIKQLADEIIRLKGLIVTEAAAVSEMLVAAHSKHIEMSPSLEMKKEE